MRAMLRSLLVILAIVAAAELHAQAELPSDKGQIDRIEVVTKPIFSQTQLDERRIYRFIDRIHKTTNEDAIRRVLWKTAGDTVDKDEVAEFEREIRDLGVFSDVDVRRSKDNVIVITTRDRVSLYPAVVPFSVGGVSGFAALIIEENLFGNADELVLATANNSDDERESRFSYTDRHVRDTAMQFNFFAGSTEEGDSFGVSLSEPFRHLRDNWSWGSNAAKRESRVDFYEAGDSVAEVPTQTGMADVFLARAYGDVIGRKQIGMTLRHEDIDFGAAIGSQAGSITVPGDLTKFTVGLFHQWRSGTHFVVERNLDRLGVDEDLELGFKLDSGIAAIHRREVGAGDRWEPSTYVNASWATELGGDAYVTLRAGGVVRFDGGDARGWQRSIEAHYFSKIFSRQIIALNVTYEEVLELDDLAAQLTLGEDNGLRGYPARQFDGRKRVRVNLEDRIDFDKEFFTFRFGGVVFFDAGWIGDESLGSVRTSVGVGLRFGSPEITGGRILRLDVAYPLNERVGEDFGATVSFSVGQVFDFFGSSNSLSSR